MSIQQYYDMKNIKSQDKEQDKCAHSHHSYSIV